MRYTLLALAIALVPAAGLAQDKPGNTPPTGPVDEILEDVLDALRFVLRAIPQYEMPEVLPNGDIIIRRVPPKPNPKPTPRPAPKEPDNNGVPT